MRDLTRRDMIRVASVAAAAVAVGSTQAMAPLSVPASAAPGAEWTHDPASTIGPEAWAAIGYTTCGLGHSQSPIDIRTDSTVDLQGSPLLLRYRPLELAVENTGHVIEVPIPSGTKNTLQIGGDFYTLSQFHFHAPSEHSVDGRRADVEAHFVHTSAQGANAVVGVFYHVGGHPNEVLDRILLAAPADEGHEAHAGEANPAELFHGINGVAVASRGMVRVGSYFGYEGSLTTPSCTEGVRWSLLADGGHVSSEAVRHLHEVIAEFPSYDGYPDNNRPIQQLNGRVVRLRATAH